MSLKQLNYLTSKEGQYAFSIILTDIMNTLSKISADMPLTKEEFDGVIAQSIDKLKDFAGNNKELLIDAFKDFFIAQGIGQHTCANAIRIVESLDVEFEPIKVVGGLLYAAANGSTVEDNNTTAMSKRDFIRLAVFLYDMNMVCLRNAHMLNNEIRIS